MKAALPLVLVAALIGFVAGFFVRDAALPEPAGAAAASPARFAERGGRSPAERVVLEGPHPGASTDARQTARGADSGLGARAIERAIEAVEPPAVVAATGDGAVVGRVVDEDDRGIPGVRVTLRRAASRTEASARASTEPRSDDAGIALEEALRAAALAWALEHGDDRTVTTDASGEFRVDALPPGGFHVGAAKDGWTFEQRTPGLAWSRGASSAADGIVLEGTEVGTLRLNLVARDGRRIESALIQLGNRRSEDAYVRWTAEDPRVLVSGGTLTLRAFADVFEVEGSERQGVLSGLASDAVTFYVAPGTEKTAELELHPRTILAGVVEGETRIARRVFASRIRAGERLDPKIRVASADSNFPVQGTFALTGLSPGHYAVGVLDEDELPRDVQYVDLVPGLNRITLLRSDVDLSRAVRARPLDLEGRYVRDCSYRFEWRKGDGSLEAEGMGVHYDFDGVDIIEFDNFGSFDIEAWPEGTRMWLVAQHMALGQARVPYALGQVDATLQFQPVAELEVLLEGAEGATDLSVTVHAPGEAGTDARFLSAATRRSDSPRITDDGRALFRNLPLGPTLVRVHRGATNWWGDGTQALEEAIVLGEGTNTLQLTVPPAYDLVVRIVPAETERWIGIARQETPTDRFDGRQTNAEGVARFTNLPAGGYTLHDNTSGAKLEVTVPGGESTWDQTGHVAKLAVAIADTEGWFARQGLRGGDLVTRVDGEAVNRETDVIERLERSGLTLTVERGGETLEIALERLSREDRQRTELGGSIRLKR